MLIELHVVIGDGAQQRGMYRVVGIELTRIGQLEGTARHRDHGAERAVLHQHGILGEVAVMAHVAQPGALAEGA